jgi:hypothetical protein
MANAELSTTFLRACVALLIGALVASSATILLIACVAIGSNITDWNSFVAQMGFAFVLAALVYALGLLLLAAPLWAFLHKMGHRSWKAAGLLGAMLGFIVTLLFYISPTWPIRPEGSRSSFGGSAGLLVEDNVVTLLGWATFLSYSAIHGVICALVGILIWRLAYRTVSPSQ